MGQSDNYIISARVLSGAVVNHAGVRLGDFFWND